MAIDTAQKRKSLVGIAVPMTVGVTPDATPDQAWRQAAGWGYVGILANVVAAPTVFGDLTTIFANYTQNTLRDANPTAVDTTTLVEKDQPTVIAGTTERADRNTQLAEYLS